MSKLAELYKEKEESAIALLQYELLVFSNGAVVKELTTKIAELRKLFSSHDLELLEGKIKDYVGSVYATEIVRIDLIISDCGRIIHDYNLICEQLSANIKAIEFEIDCLLKNNICPTSAKSKPIKINRMGMECFCDTLRRIFSK